MRNAIFLSASVPSQARAPTYACTANTVAICSAVSALVHVTLGRRPLVWGGHPAITPMIRVVAESTGIDYGSWVVLYQSTYFSDQYPEDNAVFRNVIYVDSVDGDREASLRAMRKRMFTEHHFDAAVFIGGMAGIVHEFEMFRDLQSDARIVPVWSTGGATLEVSARLAEPARWPDLIMDRDYVRMFHRHLQISVKEKRYKRLDDQPKQVEQRYWRRDNGES